MDGIQEIRIRNNSAQLGLRSYAYITEDGANKLIWLEARPEHPGVIKAIWASLVNNTTEVLFIQDGTQPTFPVSGLHRRYERKTMPATDVAAKPRRVFHRMYAPEMDYRKVTPATGIALVPWPGQSLGQSLAAILELKFSYTMQIHWGEWLLEAVIADEIALPFQGNDGTGQAPTGYYLPKSVDWASYINKGIKTKKLKIQ